MLFDPLYLLVLAPGLLLAVWASWKVRNAFNSGMRYVPTCGLSGAEAAQDLLHYAGVRHVRVEPIHGVLADHYDPSNRVLRLSQDVYYGRSLSALGVAAHETGHALQHAEKYPLLTVRNAIVPLANIGSSLSWIIILAGFALLFAHILIGKWVVWTGIGLFSLVVVFQLVNLPVEFDASRRARLQLLQHGMITPAEDTIVGKVLGAAAMTYVAATLTAVLELSYWLLRASGTTAND